MMCLAEAQKACTDIGAFLAEPRLEFLIALHSECVKIYVIKVDIMLIHVPYVLQKFI